MKASTQGTADRTTRTRLLTLEEERALLKRALDKGDRRALDQLIAAHKPLVLKVAGRYRSERVAHADLVQEGFVGLMEAARRFDPARNVRFATYAQWWIRSAIQEFVSRNAGAVRTATTSRQRTLFAAMKRQDDESLEAALGDERQRQALARRFGVSDAAVTQLWSRVAAQDVSLDAPVSGEDARTMADRVADDAPSPEEAFLDSEARLNRRRWLRDAILALPERERRIIEARHLTDSKAMLHELGDAFGVSKERVRQLEQRALARLRKRVQAMADAPTA